MKKYMRKFDGAIFDLDYTLYDEHEYFFAVFEQFCKNFGYPDRLELMKNSFLSLRSVSKDIFSDVLRSVGFLDKIPELRDELFNVYTTIAVHLAPYHDAVALLNHLQASKLKVGLLTNGVMSAQQNKLRCLSISHYFETVFCARQLGKEFEKPHIRAFQEVSLRIGITPSRLLFIGDNSRLDFQGAKAIGGITVRLRRGVFKDDPENQFVDYTVDSLEEIRCVYVNK